MQTTLYMLQKITDESRVTVLYLENLELTFILRLTFFTEVTLVMDLHQYTDTSMSILVIYMIIDV